MKSPILLLLGVVVTTLSVAFHLGWAPTSAFTALWICGFFLLIGFLWRRRNGLVFFFIALAISTLLLYEMRLRMESNSALPGIASSSQRWQGRVVGRLLRMDSKRVLLHTRYLQQDDATDPSSYLQVDKQLLLYQPRYGGQTLKREWLGRDLLCSVTLRRAERRRVPGGVDWTLYRFATVHDATGVVKQCEPLALASGDQTTSWSQTFYQRATALLAKVGTAQSRAVLQAMLLGDKGSLSEAVKQNYRRSGLYHLLVVSGLHLGLLGFFVYGVVVVLLSIFPTILLHMNRRLVATAAAFLMMALYLAVVGVQPALLRAFLLATLCALALFLNRPFTPLHALYLAAVVLLVFEPFLLFSVSFQLTMAATFGILYGLQGRGKLMLGKLKQRLLKPRRSTNKLLWPRRLLYSIAVLALVSLSAFVFTLPIIAHTFHRFSLWGPLTNLIYTPITGWLIMPLGFLGLLCIPFSSTLARGLLEAAAFFTEGVLTHLERLAALPATELQVATPSLIVIALWYLFWLLLLGKPWRYQWQMMAFGVPLFILLQVDRPWRQGVDATLLDVGDGLAAVFEVYQPGQPWSPRQVLLVDTGSAKACDSSLQPYLEHRGIEVIDALYISHWDEDHAGCVAFLQKHYPVKVLYSSYEPPPEMATDAAAIEIVRHGIEHDYGALQLSVLYPPPGALPRKSNDRSLVLHFSYDAAGSTTAPIRWLLPGDIERAAERVLLQNAPPAKRPLELLVAPHHGSRTSSSPDFVAHFRPKRVLISRRRQPSQRVMQRYERLGSQLHLTRHQGTLLWQVDSRGLSLKGYTCRPDSKPYNGWGVCP